MYRLREWRAKKYLLTHKEQKRQRGMCTRTKRNGPFSASVRVCGFLLLSCWGFKLIASSHRMVANEWSRTHTHVYRRSSTMMIADIQSSNRSMSLRSQSRIWFKCFSPFLHFYLSHAFTIDSSSSSRRKFLRQNVSFFIWQILNTENPNAHTSLA